MIQTIKALGYRVFVRSINAPTYCFYTDGTHIAYAQWGSIRESVSTVHMPNRTTGTGFVFSNSINPESLAGALLCFAPGWASQHDRESVRKYSSMDEYLNASSFNKGLIEV